MNSAELYSADVMMTITDRLSACGMLCAGRGTLSVMDENAVLRIAASGGDPVEMTDDMANCDTCGDAVALHRAVYGVRPDIRSIICAYPTALMAFGACDRLPDLTLIPGADELCGKLLRAGESAEEIAEAFAGGVSAVLLQDGGVMVGASNLFRAFTLLETIEQCAQIELYVAALGTPRMVVSTKHRMLYALEAAPTLKEIEEHVPGEDESAAREEICSLLRRACETGLASAAYGSCAVRLADGGFLVTPSDRDRFYLNPQDLLYVKNGACTPGAPSHAVRLIERIFAASPTCRAVWVAHAPCLSALAVTDGEANDRLIPEWCGLLKHASRYPYGANFLQPDMLAQAITSSSALCMIENDCVISAGTSLEAAYTQLALAEHDAKAVLRSAVLR